MVLPKKQFKYQITLDREILLNDKNCKKEIRAPLCHYTYHSPNLKFSPLGIGLNKI